MSLQRAVNELILELGRDKTYWIGFSGGKDSQALLSVCLDLRKENSLNIRAVHIHHGLHPDADLWYAHCENFCKEHEIVFYGKRVNLAITKGESIEAKARLARYQIFSNLMQAGDVLLTAHHQDDQAETHLLQLLRGAGLKGLAAMPRVKKFAGKIHARPWLHVSKQEIETYIDKNKLIYISDSSNLDLRYDRNFLRQQILPLLSKRWQGVTETMARSAHHCAASQNFIDEFTTSTLGNVVNVHTGAMSISQLKRFSLEKQQLLLRSWIYQNGFAVPNSAKLNTILHQVLNAKWDARPQVLWQGAELRRHQDHLYLMAPQKIPATFENQWDLQKPLTLAEMGILIAKPMRGEGLKPSIQQVGVRFRKGGEVVYKGNHHHRLKKLFQEWQVLPWQRERIPLLFYGDQLIAIVGYFIDPRFAAQPDEMGNEVKMMTTNNRHPRENLAG